MKSLRQLNRVSVQIRKSLTLCSQVRNKTTIESQSIEFNPNYENRNPRSLEWNGLQHKRFGWNLQYPSKDFYHQCVFRISNYSLDAYLEHCSGKTIFHLSTTDPALRQYLYSAKDLCAAQNLAKIFADKCHRFGITQLRFLKGLDFDSSTKEQAFYKILEESGIKLEEPEFIERFDKTPGLDYDNKTFYHNRQNKPFPPDLNKIKMESEKDN